MFDLNLKTLNWINEKLKLDLTWQLTEEYVKMPEGTDARDYFSAKKASPYQGQNYIQVFSDRFEFMNDLSILDLIFNVGTKSAVYLNEINV